MKPNVPDDLLTKAAAWENLSRPERADLGKALRRLGLMQSEIRQIIPVPKSTLSHWCRAVKLTPEQVDAIRQRGYPQPGVPRDTQAKRRAEIHDIRRLSRKRADDLFQDPFFTA